MNLLSVEQLLFHKAKFDYQWFWNAAPIYKEILSAGDTMAGVFSP